MNTLQLKNRALAESALNLLANNANIDFYHAPSVCTSEDQYEELEKIFYFAACHFGQIVQITNLSPEAMNLINSKQAFFTLVAVHYRGIRQGFKFNLLDASTINDYKEFVERMLEDLNGEVSHL